MEGMNLNRFPRYTQNLGFKSVLVPLGRAVGRYPRRDRMTTELRVYSYDTHVATKKGDRLIELKYYSVATRKHVNYAAEQLGLRVQHCQ